MVTSATRVETVADRLRRAVKNGHFMGGERLIEQTLANQMGVSQNTIRDALRILEGEGWVVKTARHGVHVRSFNRRDAEELYALWAAVETLALRWAMENATKGELSGLRRLIQDARLQGLTGDADDATETLFNLHTAIGNLSRRTQTAELLATLHNRAFLLELVRRARAPRSVHGHQQRIMLYEKLISLMESRDSEAAEELLSYLITTECEELLPLLDT